LTLMALAGACSTSGQESETEAFMDEFITAENQAQILEEARKSLSYEEFELVKAYGKRVEPDLAEGQLPQGRTLSEILESQRAFEASQLSPAEGSAPSEPPTQAETPQSPKPPAEVEAPRAPASAPKAPPAERKAVVSEPQPVPEPEPAPAPSPPATATVPSGTALKVRLMESLSSKTTPEGSAFETELDEDLLIDGKLVVPEGSIVTGKVSESKPSGKVRGKAQMALRLEKITVGEESYEVRSNTLRFEAEGTEKRDAKRIGIASGAGAVIGAIAGGGKGAAIGAVIGAGAGTGVTMATPGDEVEFRTEQMFQFEIDRSVEMKIR
jgi:hypothetical protein